MKFAELAQVFAQIEKTPSRNAMMVTLAELIRKATGEEVTYLVYLLMGTLRAKFDRLEFAMADKMVVRAIAKAGGEKVETVMAEYKKIGDLGEVVEKLNNELRIKPACAGRNYGEITIAETYEELEKIAKDNGVGSQERKVERLASLISQMEAISAKYVVRIVLGKLRLGFSDKTILDALSYMEAGDKTSREELDLAYQVAPDVAELAKLVKTVGVVKAKEVAKIKLGRPMMPALAQRLRTADEMIAKMGKVIVEPKYDGSRVQIHFKKSGFENLQQPLTVQVSIFDDSQIQQVRTFTRNLDENTEMFPELMSIAKQIKADEVILDSEGVGYDPKTGQMVPFQMTITRKRKHGVEEATASVPLRFFVFDILYKDGESLINRPLSERRKILAETIVEGEVLQVDGAIETDKPEELRKYHAQQLAEGLEGALVKKIEGKYLPGRQDWNWVKFKEEEGQAGKLSDTVDAVVMGYYRGKGKRNKFGMGAFLVGIRDEETLKTKTLAKIGTGLTDEQFTQLYEKLQNYESRIMNHGYIVDSNLNPDVWVEPGVVVEIAADEVTKSPIHSSGYALRFPRLVRFRDDKKVEEITSLTELKEIAGV